MLRGARTLRPAKQSIRLADRHVVDAGLAPLHQPFGVELPLLIAMGTVPVAGIVAPFILETDRDTRVVEGPQLLDQPVFQLPRPFPLQECNNRRAPAKEFG